MHCQRHFIHLLATVVMGIAVSGTLAVEKDKAVSSLNLEMWQGVGGSMKSWTVKDGVLTCDGSRGKEHANWIATKETYDDFEIALEFNVAKDGNSGVFFRAPLKGNPAKEGMEIQLFDNDSPKYSNKPPNFRTAAIWNIAAPKKDLHKKAGQWQSLRLLCVGRQCKVWHNGELVVDINLDDYKDKANGIPGVLRKGGHIGLQNHGTPFAFRNIHIKRIGKSTDEK